MTWEKRAWVSANQWVKVVSDSELSNFVYEYTFMALQTLGLLFELIFLISNFISFSTRIVTRTYTRLINEKFGLYIDLLNRTSCSCGGGGGCSFPASYICKETIIVFT